MADYKLNGTAFLRTYMKNNSIDENVTRQRIASAINIPLIHMGGFSGQAAATFERRIVESQAQSVASILGTTIGTLTDSANGPILVELP